MRSTLRSMVRSTVPLEAATASLIALTSIDESRLVEPWPVTAATALATIAVASLAIGLGRTGPGLDPPRSWPYVLLVGWMVWAAAGSVVGGLTTAALAGQMASLLLAAVVIARHGGPLPIARTLVGGFALVVGAHLVLVRLDDLAWRDDGRLQLAALEPNELARVALVAAIAGLWIGGRRRSRAGLVGLALAVVAIGAMAATGSRTAAGAFVLSAIVLAVVVSDRRLATTALGLALLLGGVLSSFATVDLPGITTAVDRTEEGTETLSGRERMWPQILDASLDTPVLGIGIGRDRDFMRNEVDVGWDPQHTHNLALHLSLTTGFIGLVILAMALLGGLARAVRQRSVLAATLLLALLIDGFSEPVMRVASFGWFALCAAVILVDRDPNDAESSEPIAVHQLDAPPEEDRALA